MKTFINNQRLAQLAGLNYDSEIIQEGSIVYSRTHLINSQFTRLSKYGPCVLITSFSDASCNSRMANRLPYNVKRWFSNNVITMNPRVIPVPIGLRYSLETEEDLRDAIEEGRPAQKNLVYMNFNRMIPRAHNPRCGIYEQFMCKDWVTSEGGFEAIPTREFYRQIASHPFVLSPPGAGPDCHRHWESIHLGSIPIVLKSTANQVLKGLPHVEVMHWGEVTEKRLYEELPVQLKKFESADMERIWFEYWEKKILEVL